MDKILRGANKNITVYFVGAGSIAEDVQKTCARMKLKFVSDYTSSNNSSDQQVLMKYTKRVLYAMCISVFTCLLLSIYLRPENISS